MFDWIRRAMRNRSERRALAELARVELDFQRLVDLRQRKVNEWLDREFEIDPGEHNEETDDA